VIRAARAGLMSSWRSGLIEGTLSSKGWRSVEAPDDRGGGIISRGSRPLDSDKRLPLIARS
jgi:hypothetical protein